MLCLTLVMTVMLCLTLVINGDVVSYSSYERSCCVLL